MKKIFFAVLTLLATAVQGQVRVDEPMVDRRVELMSVVFRLAGVGGYTDDRIETYVEHVVDRHFEKFSDHKAVWAARMLREKREIGYNAPMNLALSLDDELSVITYNTGDDRWDKASIDWFVPLLKEFAKDSDFDSFFAANADLYRETLLKFTPIYDAVDMQWFGDFFGTDKGGRMGVILCMEIGENNYGVTMNLPDGTRYPCPVIGTFNAQQTTMLLVHEYCHPFVNPLIDSFAQELKPSGEQLFSHVSKQMEWQSYGEWEIMMYEALVRASTIKYSKDHGASQHEIDARISYDRSFGFLWVGYLVEKLDEYTANREKYPTLESFMPEIVRFYDGLVAAEAQAI